MYLPLPQGTQTKGMPTLGQGSEVALCGPLGTAPQLTGCIVPHHVGVVLVAVRAQRLTDGRDRRGQCRS